MKIIITGAAGFIGYHLCNKLLQDSYDVAGIDNLNEYYDVNLKTARLNSLKQEPAFNFHKLDISNKDSILEFFNKFKPQLVIHLAAQAGVRYSIENPEAYTRSNLVGFANILEACRSNNINNLVYASSSSVYGGNTKIPFSVKDPVCKPINYYGATKRANELMAFSYSEVFGLRTTGLRFFTVYGPWGRPDMSYFKFTKNIMSGQPIDVYNNGKHSRDFTFIDDIIDGVIRAMNNNLAEEKADGYSRLYNLGNNKPVELMHYISIFEEIIGRKANLNMMEKQTGDMVITYADIDDSVKDLGFNPTTTIEEGLKIFVDWFRDYYK